MAGKKAEGKRVDHAAFDGQETAASPLATMEVTSDDIERLADQTLEQMAEDGNTVDGRAPAKLWACQVDGCPERFESADTEAEAKAKYMEHQQFSHTIHSIRVTLISGGSRDADSSEC